ncbi:MAG: hypothetical protein ACWA5K_07080 [bacterium]
MKKLFFSFLLIFSGLAWGAENCTFDADDADSPGFANKLAKCETLREQYKEPVSTPDNQDEPATLLYGAGTLDSISALSERPVVAPGSFKHISGKIYAARAAYSLRPNAKFEDSVTLAIHKIHSQMAQYCARGWSVEKEWSEPQSQQAGDYYLHYRFRCAQD